MYKIVVSNKISWEWDLTQDLKMNNLGKYFFSSKIKTTTSRWRKTSVYDHITQKKQNKFLYHNLNKYCIMSTYNCINTMVHLWICFQTWSKYPRKCWKCHFMVPGTCSDSAMLCVKLGTSLSIVCFWLQNIRSKNILVNL